MKSILVLFFLFVFTNTHSQISTISNSATVFEPQKFLHIPDGGYIGLKRTYIDSAIFNSNATIFTLSIVKYDKDMNVVKERQLSNGEKGFSGYYASIKESGNDFWVIYLEPLKVSKKSNFTNVIARKIDLRTLQTGDNKIVADGNSVDEKVNGYYASYNLKIMLETSQDKKHHALYINSGDGEFYISSLNENFEPVWKSKQIIQGQSQYSLRSFFSDNEGDILIFSVTYDDDAVISRYNTNGNPTHIKCKPESVNIYDANFCTDEETGKIIVAGTCKKNSKNITDVFKSVLNKNLLILEDIQTHQIPEDIMASLKSKGFASIKSNKYGLHPFSFRTKIFGNKENGINLIIEIQDKIGPDRAVDVIGNLIYVNLNSTNPIFSNIPRYSIVSVEKESGYYFNSFCKKNQILFYFDNEENLSKNLSETTNFRWGKSAILLAAFIAPDGSIIRKQVLINNTLGLWQSVNKFLITECSL